MLFLVMCLKVVLGSLFLVLMFMLIFCLKRGFGWLYGWMCIWYDFEVCFGV